MGGVVVGRGPRRLSSGFSLLQMVGGMGWVGDCGRALVKGWMYVVCMYVCMCVCTVVRRVVFWRWVGGSAWVGGFLGRENRNKKE